MNNPLQQFEQLAKKASREVSTEVDVQHKVMNSIARLSSPRSAEVFATRFLLGSACAALVTLAFTFFASYTEPPVEMIAPFVSSLP